MGVHGGIPKVKEPVELYENKLKELVPPMYVALDVILIPNIMVGIKHVGRKSVALSTTIYDTLTVAPNVEVIVIPKGEVMWGELMPIIGYGWNVIFWWSQF